MASEEETTIAFVFKRSGLTEISFSKFYLTLSMDLNWFTPEEAKKFTDFAIDHKLLIKKEGKVSPNFDINNIKIPIGFYPTKKIFEERKEIKKIVEKKDILQRIIERISKNSKLDEKAIKDKIKQIEKDRNLTSEVAALLICKENDIDMTDFFDDVEDKIFQKK